MAPPPPRSFSATLPLELQFAIIDIMHSDTHALALWSLVCSYWRLRCHRHAFSTAVLAWASVVFFRELIRNEFSGAAIIPAVKAIHIRGPPTSLGGWDRRRIAALADVLVSLASMGNIARFSFQNLRWIPSPPGVPTLLEVSGFRGVTTLELLEMRFSTKAELVAVLENFRGLRHLVLQDVDCAEAPSSASASSLSVLPGSYGLALRCPEVFTLQKRLRWDCGLVENVPATELAELVTLMSAGTSEILQTLGGSLHHLQLAQQTIHTYSDAHLQDLDLSHNTALKQLCLGSSKRVLSLLPWVPRILTQIPMAEPPTLTVLRFAFASSRQFHLDRPYLLFIADVLSRPQFRRLQVIEFVVFDGAGDRELERVVEEIVGEALGSWKRKGVLVFTFSKS